MHANKLLLNNIIENKDRYSYEEIIYILCSKFAEELPFEIQPKLTGNVSKEILSFFNNYEYTLVPFGFEKIVQ